MERKRLITIDVSTGNSFNFIKRIVSLGRDRISSYVCLANVHMVIEAYKDSGYAKNVNNSNLTIADGMPIAKAFKLLYGIKQDRVAGLDIMSALISEAEKQELTFFFYGSTSKVLRMICDRIEKEHPNLIISGACSPPFRQLSDKEKIEHVKRINCSGANIVLVALGCPKQEKWMAENKGKINAVMVGLGGAFCVYAGIQPRTPAWMQKCSLEWLYRLYQEPYRLFNRYLTTNNLFIWLLIKELMYRRITGKIPDNALN